MGSSELYIQRILQQNLSVVPTMAAALDTMTEQLNQTTRIMMNLLENQGITQNQAAYSGSTLAALTLTGDTTGHNCVEWSNTGQESGYPKFINNMLALKTSSSSYLSGTLTYYNIDLTGVSKIHIPELDSPGLWNPSSITLADGTGINVSGRYFTIPTAQQKFQKTIRFNGVSLQRSTQALFEAPKKVFTSGATEQPFYTEPFYFNGLGFNSSNTLVEQAPANIYSGAELGSMSLTAFLTIPDESSVAKWSTCLLNGSLEGVAAAIVDNTSHDILLTLPADTNDISQLHQTTNLALMLTFAGDGNAAKVLNSFALRYF